MTSQLGNVAATQEVEVGRRPIFYEARGWRGEVLAELLSNRTPASFYVEADGVLEARKLFNTDRDSRYTSHERMAQPKAAGVAIRINGKWRWTDHIDIERTWRSLKYKDGEMDSSCFAMRQLGRSSNSCFS